MENDDNFCEICWAQNLKMKTMDTSEIHLMIWRTVSMYNFIVYRTNLDVYYYYFFRRLVSNIYDITSIGCAERTYICNTKFYDTERTHAYIQYFCFGFNTACIAEYVRVNVLM